MEVRLAWCQSQPQPTPASAHTPHLSSTPTPPSSAHVHACAHCTQTRMHTHARTHAHASEIRGEGGSGAACSAGVPSPKCPSATHCLLLVKHLPARSRCRMLGSHAQQHARCQTLRRVQAWGSTKAHKHEEARRQAVRRRATSQLNRSRHGRAQGHMGIRLACSCAQPVRNLCAPRLASRLGACRAFIYTSFGPGRFCVHQARGGQQW